MTNAEIPLDELTHKIIGAVPLDYKGERIETRLKLDMLVEGRVIIEVKAVDA